MVVSSPLRLLIEGWRYVPHSYAISNQYFCRELIRRPDVLLRHKDMPYFNPDWRPNPAIFDPITALELGAIPAPVDGESFDAIFRMDYPYRISPIQNLLTCVFMTAEFKMVPSWAVAPGLSFVDKSHPGILYITTSQWSKQGIIRSGAGEVQVEVVPLGVDNRIFRPAMPEEREQSRRELGVNGFLFAHFGAMTQNKNIPMVFKAFAAIAAKHPEARLLLKGVDSLYGSDRLASEASAVLTPGEANLIRPRVIYRGDTLSFEALGRLYHAVDAYVSPYAAEGFNMPVLEAAACGIPVICTKGGSTDDFTTAEFALRIDAEELEGEMPGGGRGRMLAPSFDHLVAHMLSVLENPAIAARARTAGPPFVANGYLWPHVTDHLLAAIRKHIL